jgi:hypothetical protein
MGNNITSITLTTDNKILQIRQELNHVVAAGIIVATEQALTLLGIDNYRWQIEASPPVDPDKLRIQNFAASVDAPEKIEIGTCIGIGYKVWTKHGTGQLAHYNLYSFDDELSCRHFLQGIMTVVVSFNLRVEDVLVRKIARVRVLNSNYFVSYLDMDNDKLPAYSLSEAQLGDQCNKNFTMKSDEERLRLIEQHLINKWHMVNNEPLLVDKLQATLNDARIIIRYIPDTLDENMIDRFLGYSDGENGPEVVEMFLIKFQLKQ